MSVATGREKRARRDVGGELALEATKQAIVTFSDADRELARARIIQGIGSTDETEARLNAQFVLNHGVEQAHQPTVNVVLAFGPGAKRQQVRTVTNGHASRLPALPLPAWKSPPSETNP